MKNKFDKETLLVKQERQKSYRECLDNQRFSKSPLTYNYPNNDTSNNNATPSNIHPSLVDNINPFSQKNYTLGSTLLYHNPIINPVPNYRDNKYIWNNNRSTFQLTGSNIIN